MAVLDQLEAATPRIRIGYVPQVPWILSGRLGIESHDRANVAKLFG
jgi:hypothetical protein